MKSRPPKRALTISFKTTSVIKKKLIKLAEVGHRSLSREMERLIKQEPIKG